MKTKKQYWLTPEEEYKKLDKEFKFDFDPCPYPLPKNFDGLKVNWGKSNWVSPPFRKEDAKDGIGMTAFVHKGITEHKKGKQVVFILPVQSYENLFFLFAKIIFPPTSYIGFYKIIDNLRMIFCYFSRQL